MYVFIDLKINAKKEPILKSILKLNLKIQILALPLIRQPIKSSSRFMFMLLIFISTGASPFLLRHRLYIDTLTDLRLLFFFSDTDYILTPLLIFGFSLGASPLLRHQMTRWHPHLVTPTDKLLVRV
jgi:hypothetical protein